MRLVTLRGEDLLDQVLRPGAEVRDAMNEMNTSGRTLVLVVDGDRLEGVVSDGDIRRHLAKGGTIDDPVGAVVNRRPVVLEAGAASKDIRSFMIRRGVDYLPLVEHDRLVALGILEHGPRHTELSAVILAGGLGTRLAPLTDACPKPLLPLGGRPIMARIIDHLREHGIVRYTVAVNHLSHMIVDYFDDGSDFDCFIDYVHEGQRLGTGGPLALIDPDSLSDPFVCINGDVLSDVDVSALVDTHRTRAWAATMVVHGHHLSVPYGVVEVHDDGSFAGVREKPVHSFQINAGIYVLSKSALGFVPNGQYYDLPTLFDDLRDAGHACGTFEHAGRWIDIGTTADYERANSIFALERGTQ